MPAEGSRREKRNSPKAIIGPRKTGRTLKVRPAVTSEVELHGELNDTWVPRSIHGAEALRAAVRRRSVGDRFGQVGNLPGRTKCHATVDPAELRVVGSVEHFAPELQPAPPFFGD